MIKFELIADTRSAQEITDAFADIRFFENFDIKQEFTNSWTFAGETQDDLEEYAYEIRDFLYQNGINPDDIKFRDDQDQDFILEVA